MVAYTLSGLPLPDGKNPLLAAWEIEGSLVIGAEVSGTVVGTSAFAGGLRQTIGASNPPGGTEHELEATAAFPAGVVAASLALLASLTQKTVGGKADLAGSLDATLAAGAETYGWHPLPVLGRAEFGGSLIFQPEVSGTIVGTATLTGFAMVDFGELIPVNGTDNVVEGTATLTGEPVNIGTLRSPPYLFFNGTSNFVWFNDDTDVDLNGGTNFSCAVLLDPEVAFTSQSGTVVGKHDPSGTQHGWEVTWDKTTGLATVRVSSNTSGTNNVVRPNATAIRTRSILVFTYDGTDIRIVLNGATDEGTQTTTGTPGAMSTTTAKFAIGARVNSSVTGSNFHRGAVCGVWIWNATLTLGEAQSITAQGVIPDDDMPQPSALQAAWDPYSIGSNGLNTAFHTWIETVSARSLQSVASPRPLVLPADLAFAAPLFSDRWGLDFINNGEYGPDSNLTSNYPLNSSTTDASENGTYRIFTPPTFQTHPAIASGFRDFRTDITLFVRGRKGSTSSVDVIFFQFLGIRLFYDNATRDLFLFNGTTGTPDRYDYGRLQPLSGGLPAVFCLRWNVVDQTLSLHIGNVKTEPNAITATGTGTTSTGLDLCDNADYKDARVIAACITDDAVQTILNELSSLAIDSFEIVQQEWRWAMQARPDTSLLFGHLVTDYPPNDPDLTPETLFVQRGATGTLELAGQPNDGDRFTVSDGGTIRTFEFNSSGGVTGSNIAVTIGGTVAITMDNLIAAVNASPLNLTAGARNNFDATGDGVFEGAWTRLTHDQVPVSPQSIVQTVAITIPVNASGKLFATGMARAYQIDEELPITVSDQRIFTLGTAFRYTDEPYPVMEPEDDDTGGGGALPFQNPLPTIVSVTADVAHNVVATANAGPTDAGPVFFWWEVEMESGNTETVIRIDEQEGTFSLNRDQVDTFTIPVGLDFKDKRIRFVIQSKIDPDQVWASLYERMEGDEFNNDPPEVIIIPGTGAPEVPPAVDLEIALAEQAFALEAESAAALGQLRLSNRSRYKLARVFINTDESPRLEDRNPDGLEFGLLPSLADFEDLGTEYQTHRVSSNEVGFLDLIAVAYYGAGFEELWWAVAYANRIIDPERDMFPGQELVIPSRTKLTAFLTRKPEAVS